ncbi:MAG: hypothetical protein HUU15_08050 [Candidatus Brocadiae bacterium]|nr:hypothetical protein [Candidatus Brocadiia bacterium]
MLRRCTLVALALVVLTLAPAGLAVADKIVLKDGRTYEGTILQETEESVKIRTAKATMTFQKNQIESIEKSESKVGDLDKRLTSLDPAQPQKYLETARWLTKEGRELFDVGLLRRLCNAAASRDRSLAAESQLLLGKELLERGSRLDAARSFARAANADSDEGAALRDKTLTQLRENLTTDLRAPLEGLDLVIAGNLPDALPKLQKSGAAILEELAAAPLNQSWDMFVTDIASRVMCKPCGGSALVSCPACEGTGIIKCNTCLGTGSKGGHKAGKDMVVLFKDTVCRACYGQKSSLCVKCAAERDVHILFDSTNRMGKNSETVHCVAGKEPQGLRTEIGLTDYDWTECMPGKVYVASITALPISKGGRTPCGTCKGIKYNPPATPVDVEGARRVKAAVEAMLRGEGSTDLLLKVGDSTFDQAAVADGIRYVNGRWVK